MKYWTRNFILLALMLASSGMAVALRPTQKIADRGPKVDLETVVPRTFGDWREEIQASTLIIDPQQKETIDRIYNQTLSRTYFNTQGYRIMLSIAYGGDQSDSTQLHKPELCYPAQGFQLKGKNSVTITLPFGALPVTRVDAQLGQRREPITYWTTIGDQVVRGVIQKKLAEMSYNITGNIPDGLLFRVSSIDPEVARAYDMQATFIKQLLGAATPEQRKRLAGSFGNVEQ